MKQQTDLYLNRCVTDVEDKGISCCVIGEGVYEGAEDRKSQSIDDSSSEGARRYELDQR